MGELGIIFGIPLGYPARGDDLDNLPGTSIGGSSWWSRSDIGISNLLICEGVEISFSHSLVEK